MTEKTIGVAVLGAGGRGKGVTANLLRDSKGGVRVRSVFDPDEKESAAAVKYWKTSGVAICGSYQDAVSTPGVDWVMVFSPNAFHKEHILAGFKAGKHVFAEKPLATSIEDCEAIYEAHHATDRMFATGFVLRYAPIYRRAMEILRSGRIGKILGIDANENITPEHGGYIMTNWRRHTGMAGPHILEKCCHDIDLLNWFTGSVPSRIAAFGGLDFFVPGNKGFMEKFGAKTFVSWNDPHGVSCPFTSDKDLMDNHVAIMEYRNRIKVMFQATLSNAIPERRMYFSCTEGNMVIELYAGTLKYKRLGDPQVTEEKMPGDGHGGGDDYIMKELYESMVTGAPPKCSGDEGLESAVAALGIDRAIQAGTVVDLEPVWKKLNR